jgi:hypothetical protein
MGMRSIPLDVAGDLFEDGERVGVQLHALLEALGVCTVACVSRWCNIYVLAI